MLSVLAFSFVLVPMFMYLRSGPTI